MSKRSERRETARFESGAKLVLVCLVGLAFLIDGLTGFTAALSLLVSLLVAVALLGLSFYLVANSRLVNRKKIGALLLLSAVAVTGLWSLVRAPKQWVEKKAAVASIQWPPAVTETDYSFHPAELRDGPALLVTQNKSWPQLSEAQRYRPGPTTIFYNHANVKQARFEPTTDWGRALATPTTTRIQTTGEATATLRVGSTLRHQVVTTTGPHVAKMTVGAAISVWINPVTATEMSFAPRVTIGGQRFWLLGLAGVLAVGGLGLLVTGKEWVNPSAPPQALPTATKGSTAVADHLKAIDWFQFEAVSARILEADGWSVRRFGGANPDGGADLVATRDGRTAVVQCKHWRRIMVQPKIIRELLGTKISAQFAANEAILFTLSECTEAALACAQDNNVRIYSAVEIAEAVKRIGLDSFPEMIDPDNKFCPKCGAPMVLRDNVSTPFWGCSKFPWCRATIERT